MKKLNHREALIVMNMLPGIGPGRKKLLCQYFGSAENALDAGEADLNQVPGMGEKLSHQVSTWYENCDFIAEIRLAEQSGVKIITEEEEGYPPLLREIHDPPICLYVYGDLSALTDTEMALGIVGSRNCTMYGRRMAEHFAVGASRAGWPVVSGLARGIDTCAHQATLNAGGRTIAVIGSGLSRIYPQENVSLAYQIGQRGGAVISEFSMQYSADKRSFPMRNRIISGMCRGTLVVEAGQHSGSLITAAQALEQGRMVFAVPGPVDSQCSQGCHALIRDGATLVENFGDIAEEYTLLPGLDLPPEEPQCSPPPKPVLSKLHLDGLEKKLWSLMHDRKILEVDPLIDEAGEEPQCVMAALLTMELKRLIRQLPGRQLKLLVE